MPYLNFQMHVFNSFFSFVLYFSPLANLHALYESPKSTVQQLVFLVG